jgi:hypothetical protein
VCTHVRNTSGGIVAILLTRTTQEQHRTLLWRLYIPGSTSDRDVSFLAKNLNILAVPAENRQIWRHFPPKPAKTPKKTTSRSGELPGNYRRQRSVLCCSWVVLVCRMATIPPDVFFALSAHPPGICHQRQPLKSRYISVRGKPHGRFLQRIPAYGFARIRTYVCRNRDTGGRTSLMGNHMTEGL